MTTDALQARAARFRELAEGLSRGAQLPRTGKLGLTPTETHHNLRVVLNPVDAMRDAKMLLEISARLREAAATAAGVRDGG